MKKHIQRRRNLTKAWYVLRKLDVRWLSWLTIWWTWHRGKTVATATQGHEVSMSYFSIWFRSTEVEKWYPDFVEHFERTPLMARNRQRTEKREPYY